MRTPVSMTVIFTKGMKQKLFPGLDARDILKGFLVQAFHPFLWVKSLHPCSDIMATHTVHGISPGQNTGVGRLSFLQGIFLIQASNPGLLHCRQILYQLSHNGSAKLSVLKLECTTGRTVRKEPDSRLSLEGVFLRELFLTTSPDASLLSQFTYL